MHLASPSSRLRKQAGPRAYIPVLESARGVQFWYVRLLRKTIAVGGIERGLGGGRLLPIVGGPIPCSTSINIRRLVYDFIVRKILYSHPVVSYTLKNEIVPDFVCNCFGREIFM